MSANQAGVPLSLPVVGRYLTGTRCSTALSQVVIDGTAAVAVDYTSVYLFFYFYHFPSIGGQFFQARFPICEDHYMGTVKKYHF